MAAIDKLTELRNAMDRGIRPDEVNELHAIELRIKELNDYQDLKNRPGIMQLINWCKRGIREVNDSLSTDRELQKDGREGERLAMLDRRDILLYFVGLFDSDAELAEIEKELTDRVDTFQEYQRDR